MITKMEETTVSKKGLLPNNIYTCKEKGKAINFIPIFHLLSVESNRNSSWSLQSFFSF